MDIKLTYTSIGYILHLKHYIGRKIMNNEKSNHQTHPSYLKYLPRLNRIVGQIEGIKKMIQFERYCPDILTQLHAARAALRNLEIQILDNHLSHCVLEAFDTKDQVQKKQKVEEIRIIMKRIN